MSHATLASRMPPVTPFPACTIGLDIGDRYSYFHELDAAGQCVAEGRVATTAAAIAQWARGRVSARVVLETSTHSPWLSRLVHELGHEVIVANARRLQLIGHNVSKSDRADAALLARLGRVDPQLLAPVQHRGPVAQAHLAQLRTRDALVRTRTLLVNHVRGTVKAVGGRVPRCSTESFPQRAAAALPLSLAAHLTPVLAQLTALTQQIRAADRALEQLLVTTYPEAQALTQVPGVGALTALCFVLTLEDPARFPTSRAVGSYLGLRPRRRASSGADPECHITKAGDVLLRRLLVGSAQYLLGPFGPDTDLRRWGLALAARGRKAAKKRAVVAVARKLAVLLHRLWVTQARYIPCRDAASRAVPTA
jgi:transposase